MENIGKINDKEIFYISIRDNSNWFTVLPTKKWIAFTIVDTKDKEMLNKCTEKILDRNVSYTCSAGELASLTEDYFDEEIVYRAVLFEEETGEKFDYNKSLMTTSHRNFSEGFWFASTLANDEEYGIKKVVCIDFTTKKVKNYLTELVSKIKDDWLPSDEEIELAIYDC